MTQKKPTKLKLLQGNPGGRELPENEPEPEVGAECPSWISEEAKKHWKDISKPLEDCGILTEIDSVSLGLYCDAFARYKNACDYFDDVDDKGKKNGMITKSANGFEMPHPYVGIMNQSFEQMRKLLIEFGMTPSARSKVKVTKKTKKNAFANMKNKGKVK